MLTAAATVVAALILAAVRMGFSDTAEQNAKIRLHEMLAAVLPGSRAFEWEDYKGEDPSVRAVYRGETGYVVETSAYGYAGEITMLVGVSGEGTVQGLVVCDLQETWRLGANALTDTAFLTQFLGTSGDAEIGTNVDSMTGATVSSKAVARAVNAAVSCITGTDAVSAATEWGG